MERPLIPGWLAVEFPDCKEQTITFKRGWVCVGGVASRPYSCEIWLFCRDRGLGSVFLR